MGFWEDLRAPFAPRTKEGLLKTRPKEKAASGGMLGRFAAVPPERLAAMDGALLSFVRERSFRGNARNFRILMDGHEIGRIENDAFLDIPCPPGIHSLHIRLDRMTSAVINLKAEQGRRYYFDIVCTMEEGLCFTRIEDTAAKEEQP
jgi:hypothetical protein